MAGGDKGPKSQANWDICSMPPAGVAHTVASMESANATDQALEQAVRAWLSQELRVAPDLADRITQMAVAYRATGASVEETCEWVMDLARPWAAHPPAVPLRRPTSAGA